MHFLEFAYDLGVGMPLLELVIIDHVPADPFDQSNWMGWYQKQMIVQHDKLLGVQAFTATMHRDDDGGMHYRPSQECFPPGSKAIDDKNSTKYYLAMD